MNLWQVGCILNYRHIKTIILAFFCIVAFSFLNAQETAPEKEIIYKTWIILNNEDLNKKGYLYELNDSSISIISNKSFESYPTDNLDLINLQVENINFIKTRRKNRIGRSMLGGALTGFAIGGLIAISEGDDPSGLMAFTAEEKVLFYGVPLAGCGTIIGSFCGSFKVNIPINGNLNIYNIKRNILREYTLLKN